MANVLSTAKRSAVISALVEGNSIRATVRMTGVSKNTIAKLLVELAGVCQTYADENLRNLPCKRLQVDEIWAFCYSKAKNVPAAKKGVFGYGDVWTFCAIDADTKLVPSWLVGSRDVGCATELMQDLASRLSNRVQLTTDGHKMYLSAMEEAFGGEVDYAMLQKIYSNAPSGPETRYSPAECTGAEKHAVTGCPDEKHVSTSYVERQNLTMRMSIRRFTRLTNAFSKKVENHAAQVAVHFFHYNFCRPHMTLKGRTPCQAAGVDSRRWSIEDMVILLPDTKESN
ncbi:MAG: DDE-type integrase/transposase/recombinase [Acidobacteria bacterium]|nr:DDE-type integrase/transposase/recombinase [Acidobacteriota bacterium]